jgi:ATP-dependent RNA/DNA helicase IGHMBP2
MFCKTSLFLKFLYYFNLSLFLLKNKLRKPSTDRNERERLKKEIKNLRKDIRTYEEKASREAMKSVNVILCTLTSATDDSPLRLLPPNHFDLVVIDECSQVNNILQIICYFLLNIYLGA